MSIYDSVFPLLSSIVPVINSVTLLNREKMFSCRKECSCGMWSHIAVFLYSMSPQLIAYPYFVPTVQPVFISISTVVFSCSESLWWSVFTVWIWPALYRVSLQCVHTLRFIPALCSHNVDCPYLYIAQLEGGVFSAVCVNSALSPTFCPLSVPSHCSLPPASVPTVWIVIIECLIVQPVYTLCSCN